MDTRQEKRKPPIIGSAQHAVDAKGRLIIPARWRVGIGADLYVTPNPDGALVVMTEEEFQTMQQKALDAPVSEEDRSGFQRFLASSTQVTQMDRQGRINLNEATLNRGGIRAGDEVVLNGKISRFEIYSLERWGQVQAHLKRSFDNVSQQIGL